MPHDDKQTPAEQIPQPSIDDLIAHTNAEAYVFERKSERRSPKQWFLSLNRTRKVLLLSSAVFLVFVVGVIALTKPHSGSSTLSSSNTSIATNEDTNGDGVIDENDSNSSVSGDTNGDGVVDSRDDSASNTTDETSSSWWSNLFAKAEGALKGGSSSSDNSSSDGSTDDSSASSDDSYFASDSSYFSDETYDFDESTEDITQYNSSKIAASKGVSTTIATWNVLKYDNSVSNMRAGVKDIFAAGATIIGLQEISSPSFTPKSVTSLGSSSVGTYSPAGGSAVVWDTSKVEKISADSFRPIASKEKRFVYVKFRLRSTGQQFYVVNQHMEPGVNDKSENCGTTNCKNYKAQMKTLVAKIKQLQSSNLPIILVGDFNVDYQLDSRCKVTWYPCYSLGKIDMVSSYKALKLKNTDGSAKKYIDQAYFWTAAAGQTMPVSNKILGSGSGCKQSNKRDIDGDIIIHCWHASDHKPLLFTAKLGKS